MTPPRGADERGMVTVELVAYYAIVIVAVVGVLHLFVAGYAAVAATGAARAGARTAGLGGGPGAAEAAAVQALAPGLRAGATVEVAGGRATVHVAVPSLFGGGTSLLTLTRSAELPETGDLVELAPPAAGGAEGPS